MIRNIYHTVSRKFSTTKNLFHDPSLKRKNVVKPLKAKKTTKSKIKRSDYGEAANFKPSYHYVPFDPLLLSEIGPDERCNIADKMTDELKSQLIHVKIQEDIAMNKYIHSRLKARDHAMRLLRCKFPTAYIRLIESLPKTRHDRKPKEADIIPGDPPLLKFPLKFLGPCESAPIKNFKHADEVIESDFNDTIVKKHLKTDF